MSLWTYLAAIPVLLGIVLLHELGHFVAARRAGIAAEEFSVGFGPRLMAWYAFGTRWTLRAIPLGGYVRFVEEGARAFHRATPAARARVMMAGPLVNVAVTAVLLGMVAAVAGFPWWHWPWLAAKWTALLTAIWFGGLGEVFAGSAALVVDGPVMIATRAAEAAAGGGTDLLFFSAKLCLNLGLINLLPLPVLDGGRLVLLGIEWARRRRLHPDVEGWLYAGSTVALLLLTVVLFGKDIVTLVRGTVS